MEEDMGLSFDATMTAKEAKNNFRIPIFKKKEEDNEDEMDSE